MMRAFGAVVLASALGVSAHARAAADSAPVADAAQQGDRDAVRTLLKQAADVNGAQGDGMTALHWAAMKNDGELAQMLLFAGANVRATTRIGAYTPLLLAAQHGNAAAIDALVKGGADVNARTANGTTPLMFASASGSVDAVQALLDKGADVAAVESTRGLNAAMFAASADRATVVDLLAKRGADLGATTKIVKLHDLDRNAFGGILFGNPVPPGQAQGAGRGGPQGQAGQQQSRSAPAFGGRGQGKAGIDRQYQLNELVYAQGGLAPLHLAARQGYTDTVKAVLDAGAGIDQLTE